jgi:hypothetical protein
MAEEWCETISMATDLENLKEIFTDAYKYVKNDKKAVEMIGKAKDERKAELS